MANAKKKQKQTEDKLLRLYNELINRFAESAIEWRGLPEELESEEVEKAVNKGAAVVYKVPDVLQSASSGRYVCTPIEWTGRKISDGTHEGFTTRGYDYSITKEELGGKYVIIRNNFRMTSELDNFGRFSMSFVDTDKAERSLIRWCRINPVALVPSYVDAAKLEQVLYDVYEGRKPFAVMNDDTKIATGQPKSAYDNVLNLVDVSAVDKLHFMSEYRYELLRRLCNMYNIPFHENAKSAQSLESELHNTDIFSQILPSERLKWRRKSIDEFQRVFGWTVEVVNAEWVKKENQVIENVIEAEAASADQSAADQSERVTENEAEEAETKTD